MPSSRHKRSQQTRLTFTPLPPSSPASKGYPQQIRDRSAAVSLDISPSPAKRRRLHSSNTDEGGKQHKLLLPTPEASNRRRDGNGVDVEVARNEDGNDSDPIPSTQRLRPSNSAARQCQQRLDFQNARDASSFDPPLQLQSSSYAPKPTGMFSSPMRGAPTYISSDESSEAESDLSVSLSPAKLSGLKDRRAEAGSSPEVDVREVQKRQDLPEQSDDEDSDLPTTKSTQRRKARRPVRPDFIDDPPSALSIDDSDTSENDEPDPVTPKKRRLAREKKLTQREKADLAEDLDFLAPSSEDQGINFDRQPRSTQSARKTARALALEKLKRKRSTTATQVEPDAEEPDESDLSLQELHPGVLEDDDEDELIELSNRPTSSYKIFEEDEHDAEFLAEDDEDDILGVPSGMPLEFTRHASKKPKQLFKHAVEWFVQKKINPAYERNDEIYDLTFKKLDDEVQGLAGSKFTSSAWTPAFTLALQARPDIQYYGIDRTTADHFMRDKCDACNRGQHPATWAIEFLGTPYYKSTLEDVPQQDEDGNSSSDVESSTSGTDVRDDQEALNAQGRKIPAASTVFYVGKFCMANARTAHALNHWRYALNQWVETWLIGQGYCSPQRLVERDGWKTERRRKYANKIADRMEREGVIKKLYRDFRNNIDDARNSKQGRYTNDFDSP